MEDRSLISYIANIGGRQYPLKINPSEKELIEKTLHDIGERVAKMKANYTSKDAQDWIAMAFLKMAYDQNKNRTETPDSERSIHRKLDEINHLLDPLLD